MGYSKSQYRFLYLLMVIVIAILLTQAQEIRKRRILFSQDTVELKLALPVLGSHCRLETRYFEFELPHCTRLEGLAGAWVIGRVERKSDGGIFVKKRLIVERITPIEANLSSLNDWPLLVHHKILEMRRRLIELLLDKTHAPQGSLAVAVVFGNTSWLTPSIKPAFETTGTLHILAASGQNIALVTGMVTRIIPARVPFIAKGVLQLVAATTYLALVGFQPSLVRATVMAYQVIAARYLMWKQQNSLYCLVLTVGVVLCFRPEWLVAMGFQLSVMATVGMIVLYPVLLRKISLVFLKIDSESGKLHNTISQYVAEAISAGVAAQVFAGPIIYWKIGSFPLLSFIPSAVVGWLIPILMYGTAVTVLLQALLQLVQLPTWFVQVLSVVSIWLPSDLFLRFLFMLSGNEWAVITNPWLTK